MRLLSLIPVLSLFVATVTMSRPAPACQCSGQPTVAQERARSNAVFDAEVLGARLDGKGEYVADVRITRVWHGSPPERLTIWNTDCPPTLLTFGPDGRASASGTWLVYAYEGGGRWHANMCGRSRPYPAAAEDAPELQRLLGQPPLAASAAPPTASSGPSAVAPRPQTGCACRAGSDSQEAGDLSSAFIGAMIGVALFRRRGKRSVYRL
jgi:hypothetical protein